MNLSPGKMPAGAARTPPQEAPNRSRSPSHPCAGRCPPARLWMLPELPPGLTTLALRAWNTGDSSEPQADEHRDGDEDNRRGARQSHLQDGLVSRCDRGRRCRHPGGCPAGSPRTAGRQGNHDGGRGHFRDQRRCAGLLRTGTRPWTIRRITRSTAPSIPACSNVGSRPMQSRRCPSGRWSGSAPFSGRPVSM